MTLLKEFQEFIARGNVVDMAVGVLIGAAFGKVVTSFVTDVLMPPIGLLIGNAPFKTLSFTLRPEEVLADGKIQPATIIHYGAFIQTIVDFLIICACIFLLVKLWGMVRRTPTESGSTQPPPEPEDIQLLREIRDSIRQQKETITL